jgi:pSer/pThr/pTyr-binding forkhead associated (FHA) protein
MADIPVLACTAGKLVGRVFQVPDDRGLRIGRAEDNDVVIVDEGVSRFHAELIYQNGSLWLQDAGSRNGVFVNAVRVVAHQALKVGDEVVIADHRFAIRWKDAVESPAPAEAEKRVGSRKWFWPFG